MDFYKFVTFCKKCVAFLKILIILSIYVIKKCFVSSNRVAMLICGAIAPQYTDSTKPLYCGVPSAKLRCPEIRGLSLHFF